ncbi:MAG TPA: TlpA disulfide reductase family protein [Anaerolineaceae bacterium]
MDTIDKGTTSPIEARRLPTWVIILAFALLLGFLAILALGLRRTMQGPITVGQNVPAFSIETFDRKTINTADLAGKVIVVNFWASWCKPCEQEADELEMAWLKYQPGGKVVFLGLAYVDTEPNSLEYMRKFKITYPNGPDLETKVSQMFRIRGVPETYIIAPNGTLAYVKIGPFTSLGEIISIIDPLIAK